MTNGNIDHDKVLEILLADMMQRETQLRRDLAEIEAAKQALQATCGYERQAFERIRSEVDRRPLSAEETKDKSQRAILHLIAHRNRGWLVVQPAIKLMVDVGHLPEETASAQVYTVLRQNNKEFQRVREGIYKLTDTENKGLAERPKKIEPNTGLVDKVAAVVAMHPNWKPKKICEELLRQGWDFGNKKPIFSVGMAYANLARRRKRASRQAPLLLRSVS